MVWNIMGAMYGSMKCCYTADNDEDLYPYVLCQELICFEGVGAFDQRFDYCIIGGG
jgi:hypothetical protein